MEWKIYTKLLPVDGGIVMRWFWRKPVTEGRTESSQGFTSRAECEADAARHGYRADSIHEDSAMLDGDPLGGKPIPGA